MIDAYVAAEIRAAEKPLLAAERGFAGGLMDRAAAALALAAARELAGRTGRVVGGVVVGLVGPGNNGGDTLHALARLARRGARAVALLSAPTVHEGGLDALRRAGGRVLLVADDEADDTSRDAEGLAPPGTGTVWVGDAVAEAFAADVVLDGLLGIGARGGLRGTAALLVGLLEDLRAEVADGGLGGAGPVVLAVDVPSGVGVDDGQVPGPVLHADRTVTFGAAKPALLLPPAAHRAGAVEVVDLGLVPTLAANATAAATATATATAAVRRWEPDDVRRLLPVPGPTAHKYSRGVVGVVAGSSAYPGAAVLAVAGALGAGCGMVRYLGPELPRAAVLAAHPEVVAGPGRVQSWVLGPGVAADDGEQRDALEQAFDEAATERRPAVVDAGALAALPERVGPWLVLTPHAGELARLLGAYGRDVTREQVEAEPLRHAREAYERTGATVLLKGAVTVVVGDGVVLSQADAPPWLATAGAGDVLAGVLGSLLAGRADEVAQRPALAAELAAGAAFLHGRAAHLARPGGPVRASEVARAVPDVVADVLHPERHPLPEGRVGWRHP